LEERVELGQGVGIGLCGTEEEVFLEQWRPLYAVSEEVTHPLRIDEEISWRQLKEDKSQKFSVTQNLIHCPRHLEEESALKDDETVGLLLVT
jgi:hypothetical protein